MSDLEVSVAEVQARLGADDASAPPVLLDVREHEELALASIDGALHVPMGEVTQRFEEIPKECEVIVFCHHGMRSLAVAAWLARLGVEAKSMRGGIDAWSTQVDERVPRY